MIELRAATPDDVPELSALEAVLFGVDAWSSRAVSDELAELGRTRTVLVAVEAGRICAYGVVLGISDDADLQRIAVAATHQRRGIGSLLLRELIAGCLADGRTGLLLEVAADNSAALELYRRHGFTEIARRPRYYSGKRDAVVMRRPLGPEPEISAGQRETSPLRPPS